MANPNFKVGEMVITQHATYFNEFNGSLGIVIHPLQRKPCLDLNLMEHVHSHVYGVRLLVAGDPKLWFRPWQLRKLDSDNKFKSNELTKKSGRNQRNNLVMVGSASSK